MAIDIVQRKVEGSDDRKNHTQLTIDQILHLITLLSFTQQLFYIWGISIPSGIGVCHRISSQRDYRRACNAETALETSPVKPKWWRRYVDDSNACIKRDGVEVFHTHFNSINANIQFTEEMHTIPMGKKSTAFLDTNNTVNEDGKIEVGVYRKATHTSKNSDFHSHSQAQSKRAVVKSSMDRAKCIPSTTAQRQSEERRVINNLKTNGYPQNFIKSVDQPNNAHPKPRENPKAYGSIPYIKGVSERIRWILNRENIKTAFKPLKTLGHVFKKPKD